ncbi:exodeoxyribonuclease III [Rickettsiales bacterium LUAb2]
MLIATFNVNSFRSRLPLVLNWIKTHKPSVLMLQEIKGLEDCFPKTELDELNYNYSFKLQKTYNGVATLSPFTIEEINNSIPNFIDEQARFLETKINNIHFINVYIPNGNPIDTDKYTYKLNWLNAFYKYISELVDNNTDFVIAGDFNIIPYEYDVYNPASFKNDALYQTEVRKIYFKLLNLGLTDAIDITYPNQKERYTWWDYRNAGFIQNKGVRIDHILLSPRIASQLTNSHIDKTLRNEEKPSDHTPVYCKLGC